MNILVDPAARPVIGHRGNRVRAPENTIESFAQAVALGADAIEFDVHMSADGIPVVHHDPTLTRTTDGSGEIARLTFAELRKADAGAQFTSDAGATFPYRSKGHRIPSLEEVIEAFPETPLLIEIKAPIAATGVLDVLRKKKAEDRVLVDSFHSRALDVFSGTGIPIGASRNGSARLLLNILAARTPHAASFSALCLPLSYYGVPLPIRKFAEAAPQYDARLHVWTVNDVKTARDLWSWGVNGIISDDPGAMLELRKTLPAV